MRLQFQNHCSPQLVGGVGDVVGGGEFVAGTETPTYCDDWDAGVLGGLDVGTGIANHNGVGAVSACFFHYIFNYCGIGLKGILGAVAHDCNKRYAGKEFFYESFGSGLYLV